MVEEPCRACSHPPCNRNGKRWLNVPFLGMGVIIDENKRDFVTEDSDWQLFVQIVFRVDHQREPTSLRQRIKDNRQWSWYQFHNYTAFHAVCDKCGAVMQCGWTPTCTSAYRHQQRANLLTWCGFEVPEI